MHCRQHAFGAKGMNGIASLSRSDSDGFGVGRHCEAWGGAGQDGESVCSLDSPLEDRKFEGGKKKKEGKKLAGAGKM